MASTRGFKNCIQIANILLKGIICSEKIQFYVQTFNCCNIAAVLFGITKIVRLNIQCMYVKSRYCLLYQFTGVAGPLQKSFLVFSKVFQIYTAGPVSYQHLLVYLPRSHQSHKRNNHLCHIQMVSFRSRRERPRMCTHPLVSPTHLVAKPISCGRSTA